MTVRITTLSEDTLQDNFGLGLLGELGLSLLIEADGQRILFDTGQTGSAVHNAKALGQDLSTVDKIALSHGHYDHTGGLREVLRAMRKKVEVIAHPDIWAPKYGGSAALNIYRYVGIPFQREELESRGAVFVLDKNPHWITENIVVTGEIPMVTEDERIAGELFVKEKDTFVPDPILDDRALIIRSEGGLIVIAGCAHRGIINTLRYAQELTQEKRLHAVLGGFHLGRASEEQRELTIAGLRELRVERLSGCHCTGLPAAARMAQEFGDNYFFNSVGVTVDFS